MLKTDYGVFVTVVEYLMWLHWQRLTVCCVIGPAWWVFVMWT